MANGPGPPFRARFILPSQTGIIPRFSADLSAAPARPVREGEFRLVKGDPDYSTT